MTPLSDRCRAVLEKVAAVADRGLHVYAGHRGEGRQLLALQRRGLVYWDHEWHGYRPTPAGARAVLPCMSHDSEKKR